MVGDSSWGSQQTLRCSEGLSRRTSACGCLPAFEHQQQCSLPLNFLVFYDRYLHVRPFKTIKRALANILYLCAVGLKGAIGKTRSEMKKAGASHPTGGGGDGALLRKLLSVEGSSDNTIKDPVNRMTLSDEEIVTQTVG